MKTVYFVRHGESEGNAGTVWVDETSQLSEKGKGQAGIVAERFIKLPVDIVISSSMTRSIETAGIIAGRLNKKVEQSDLFGERKHPSILYGKVRIDPAAVKISDEVRKNFHLPGYRYSDEENFDDFKKRSLACLEYLENRSEEHIVVVTHGFFLRVLMAAVVFGDELTGEECEHMIRSLLMDNTGITVVRLRDAPYRLRTGELGSKWELRVWNDHAHLG